MKKKANVRARGFALKPIVASTLIALAYSGSVGAFQIDVGNSDLNVRWDNTVKYNAGWRMESRDKALGDSWALQAGEYKFDRGDMVTNRIDILSEFDVIYKQFYGFRVSAAGWYDAAYNSKVHGNPAYQSAGLGTAYPGNRFPNSVSRWYTSSGEFLDTFVFGRIMLGDSPMDLKVGRHTVYWGESLFSPIHGVSYSQGPVDFRKAMATPGSEAKELFLPLNQVSATYRVNDQITASAQYFLEWDPYRIYEGGTYFTYFDPFFQAGTNYLGIPYRGDLKSGPFATPDDRGSWGVNAKYRSDFGTWGVYYRKFDDKVGSILSPNGDFSQLYNAYGKDVKLYGLSLSTLVGSTAVAAELVRRENTVLNTGFGAADMARGDTWHALVNSMSYFGSTPVFDAALLMAELTYSRLGKVYGGTQQYYNAVGYAQCATGRKKDGCSTKDALGISVTFTPTWYSVAPQVDLSMPIHFETGLYGNSPVPFGGNEGSGTWSVGLSADYQAKYTFNLTYTDYFGDYTKAPNPFYGAVPGIGPEHMGTVNGGNALLHDRGWLSFTFKTTF